jgi:GT2 family glycosyltransferase
MKVAAITLTYNRLELTKKTVESFYEKTNVDFHLFVDNYSTDGTREWLQSRYNILLDRNYGIAQAFIMGVEALMAQDNYDFILKLDNDIETVTHNIIGRMLDFYALNGDKFVASPTDLLLDPNFAPRSFQRIKMNGFDVEFVTHTGGAFQLIPIKACKMLCDQFTAFSQGDYAIGPFFTSKGYKPVYLRDLEMRHIGLNQSTPGNNYIL